MIIYKPPGPGCIKQVTIVHATGCSDDFQILEVEERSRVVTWPLPLVVKVKWAWPLSVKLEGQINK